MSLPPTHTATLYFVDGSTLPQAGMTAAQVQNLLAYATQAWNRADGVGSYQLSPTLLVNLNLVTHVTVS